jgi:predicted GTPase
MALDGHDIERLKEIFVTRQECQAQTDTFETKLNKDLVRLAVIETKLSQITWLLGAVVGGVITMLVKMFFGG